MTEAPAVERLFFALWPDAATRERCAHLARKIGGKSGKRVAAENLHITLAFLGSVDADTRACVERAADAVHAAPMTLRLDRVGYFAQPRVLWIGSEVVPPGLTTFARALHDGVTACGVTLDPRPFVAHMTLMRKVPHAPARVDIDPIDWRIDAFCLVRSQTLPEGPVYTVQRRWAFE